MHNAEHVAWLDSRAWPNGDLIKQVIGGEPTFVTNNARDVRRLFARAPIHAGLVIIVPQFEPAQQRELFGAVLVVLSGGLEPANEVVEVTLDRDEAVITQYNLSA